MKLYVIKLLSYILSIFLERIYTNILPTVKLLWIFVVIIIIIVIILEFELHVLINKDHLRSFI